MRRRPKLGTNEEECGGNCPSTSIAERGTSQVVIIVGPGLKMRRATRHGQVLYSKKRRASCIVVEWWVFMALVARTHSSRCNG